MWRSVPSAFLGAALRPWSVHLYVAADRRSRRQGQGPCCEVSVSEHSVEHLMRQRTNPDLGSLGRPFAIAHRSQRLVGARRSVRVRGRRGCRNNAVKYGSIQTICMCFAGRTWNRHCGELESQACFTPSIRWISAIS